MYKASTRDKPRNTKKKASIKHYSFALTLSGSNVNPSQTAKAQMPAKLQEQGVAKWCLMWVPETMLVFPLFLLKIPYNSAIGGNRRKLQSLELGFWCIY